MNTPYRREGDTWQIDLRLDRLQQLADTRDPSPFSRRDLAPDAERYILDACRELPAHEGSRAGCSPRSKFHAPRRSDDAWTCSRVALIGRTT